MLYLKPRPMHPPAPLPLHYLDSADMLRHLRGEGHSLADMAHLTGLSPRQVGDRLRLIALDAGLQTYLRRENVPEQIALTLLRLPDPVSRRRLARRIAEERLCIRDAALLVASALRKRPSEEEAHHGQRIIAIIRDTRPYRNAVRHIAEQMNTAGVRATYLERRSGPMQEMTIAYPVRRRRTERYHAV